MDSQLLFFSLWHLFWISNSCGRDTCSRTSIMPMCILHSTVAEKHNMPTLHKNNPRLKKGKKKKLHADVLSALPTNSHFPYPISPPKVQCQKRKLSRKRGPFFTTGIFAPGFVARNQLPATQTSCLIYIAVYHQQLAQKAGCNSTFTVSCVALWLRVVINVILNQIVSGNL